ncbi:class I SAM-dependent rRNA methyltransferase [Chloroflexota bacterium]
MAVLTIKHSREKSIRNHHPWVFSGSIEKEEDGLSPGQTVDLVTREGVFLARAAYSPHSQIRARIWTFEQDELVDINLLRRRIISSLAIRQRLNFFDHKTSKNQKTACRLIHGESDHIPGLIVDQYADHLVVQFLSAGAEFWKTTLVDLLIEETGIENVFNRSDADVRYLEGLPIEKGLIQGKAEDSITINENGLFYKINLREGHKTGFYLDQSRNRKRVKELAIDCDVLDCFSYTGGFSMNALAGGAKSIVMVDSSGESLTSSKDNIGNNNLPLEKVEIIEGDVFHLLRKFRDSRRSFDMIVLDPPKFAQSTSQVEKASRGYKDINLLAFKLLRPGGFLVTFSCSGGIKADLFQKIVSDAALDAGVRARIIERLYQSGDHPISLDFPEGSYLKGLICIRE